MADKRRRPPTDDSDDDDDDFGLRTPVKKPTAKHDKAERAPERRPAEKKKVERVEPKTAEAAPPPRKEGSGKRKAIEPRSAAAPGAGGSRLPVMVMAGALVAAAAGGGLFLAMSPGDAPPPVIGPAPTTEVAALPARGTPRVEPTRPGTVAPKVISRTPMPGVPAVAEETKPVLAPPPPPAGNTLADLRARSANHEAVARLLDQYAELTRLDPLNASPMFQDFRDRERREQELLEELRRMGPGIIPALSEMLLELDQRANQLFMAKALAGMEGPEALAAVENALGSTKDVALQTTLVRFLPDSPDAAASVARAFGREENPNLRSMLLREYARRLGEDAESGREVFSRAALEDTDPNVRAEAVTLIGRRGDPRDQALMEQIINQEPNLPIRQRAVMSYAETGKDSSLPYLENLARDTGAPLPMRASAVLAIGRVGGDRAIQTLDLMAQSDPDQEIRLRAQRQAASLRARQQAERDGTAPSELEGGSVVPQGPSPLGR